jgi:hypothetical protein
MLQLVRSIPGTDMAHSAKCLVKVKIISFHISSVTKVNAVRFSSGDCPKCNHWLAVVSCLSLYACKCKVYAKAL